MATVTKQISASDRDADQGGTTVTVTGTVLNANAATQWIGLIFDDLDALIGMVIDDAHLECYFTSGSFDDPKVTIKAGVRSYWAGTTNEISGLSTTVASVTWDENGVGTGWNSSPDLTDVITEGLIILSGGSSRFVILINGIDSTSLMRIRGYDGSSTEAAKLVINYHAPYVLHEATAADTIDVTGGISQRRIFRATVTETLDLAGGMVNRADFISSLTDLLEVTETAAPHYTVRRLAADTWRLTPAATRRADYLATATDAAGLSHAAAFIAASESGTIDVDAYEDSYELTAGTINLTAITQDCYSPVPYNAIEFRNIDVPYLAIPLVAYLKLWPNTYDDPGLTIRAEKSHSPAALSATADDISDRTPLTTAGVDWSAANIGVGAYRNSPDLSSVLAEVFALPGWTRGTSDLVLVLTNNATGGWLRYVTTEGTDGQRPVLHVEWVTNGVILSAEAADVIEYMQDITRRKVAAALTADALGLTAAVTSIIGVLSADALGLSDAVGTLSQLAVGDALLFGDGVFSAYAMSLTEPVMFSEVITRLATYRAASVDALRYTAGLKTAIGTAAGDEVTLAQALTARRIFTAAVSSGAWLTDASTSGDLPELLVAIATDALDLLTLANADWATRATAADTVDLTGNPAVVRRFVGLAVDAGAVDDVAAAMKRARAGAIDAAEFADALRSIMRTRAVDALDMSDAAIADVAAILRALAADALAFDEGTSLVWTVNAHDRLEFVATVAALMHWIEELGDTVGVTDLSVVFLPHGKVAVSFATRGAAVSFEIAMPSVDIELIKH